MASKKKSKSKKSVAEVGLPSGQSIDIRKVNNGFIVSSFSEKGQESFIAKTKKEADKFSDKMLGV